MAGQRIRAGALLSALCLGVTLALGAPAAGQELQPLIDRVERLEKALNLIEKRVYRGESPPEAAARGVPPSAARRPGLESSVAARLEVRLTELETQLRDLTGKIEELTYNLGQLRSRLETVTSDMELRLSQLEDKVRQGGTAQGAETPPGPGEGGQAGEGATAGAETQQAAVSGEALPEGTPKQQYDHAFSLLVQQDFAAAERALRAFVEAHPDHPLASNAQYWLGETFYVRGDNAQAAVTFAEGYQKYKNGSKAPDNLLKLGMSLASLGETDKACTTLGELRRRFPDGPQAILDRAAREQQRIGCK